MAVLPQWTPGTIAPPKLGVFAKVAVVLFILASSLACFYQDGLIVSAGSWVGGSWSRTQRNQGELLQETSANRRFAAKLPTFRPELLPGDSWPVIIRNLVLENKSHVHELSLFRGAPIAYDALFTKDYSVRDQTLVSQTHSGRIRWAVRFLGYLQRDDLVSDLPWSKVSGEWESLVVRLDFAPGDNAGQFDSERLDWVSSCDVRPGEQASVLLIECPLPKHAQNWFEDRMKSDAFRVDLLLGDADIDSGRALPSFPLLLRVEAPKRSNGLVMCLMPHYGKADDLKLIEWIEYHRLAVSVDHFYLYAHGQSALASNVTEYYRRKGIATLIPWSTSARGEKSDLPRNYFDQNIIYNDCTMRNRYQAKWVALLDLDEYLVVPPVASVRDAESLKTILDTSFAEAAEIKVQRLSVGGETNTSSPLMIGRRVERLKEPFADQHEVKSIVNPLKVKSLWVHWGEHNEELPGSAYNSKCKLPLDLGYIGHYRASFESIPPELVAPPDSEERDVRRWVPELTAIVEHVLAEVPSVGD